VQHPKNTVLPFPKQGTIPYLRSLLLLYLLALLIAAILTPPIFNAVLYWDRRAPCSLTRYLVGKNFTIFFERIRLISFFLFTPYLLKIYRQLEVIWPTRGPNWPIYWRFFAIGSSLIGIIFGLKILAFGCSFTALSIAKLVRFFLSALALSFLEEWLFRGIIFRILAHAIKPLYAIIFSSFDTATLNSDINCCTKVTVLNIILPRDKLIQCNVQLGSVYTSAQNASVVTNVLC
jgi:membrane protease YdiL (CAAX protease family)